MRSIRHRLLGLLLLLLAFGLGAVGVLVDRFANGAIRSREASEAERIEQQYKVRQAEAKAQFDAQLLAEAKSLAPELSQHTRAIIGPDPTRRFGGGPGGGAKGPDPKMPDPPAALKATEAEAREFRLRTALIEFAPGPFRLPAVAPAAGVEPLLKGADARRHHPYPGWAEFFGPRVLPRIQDGLRKLLSEDEHPPTGHYQVALVGYFSGRGRAVATVGSERLQAELAVDPLYLDPLADQEPKFDDVSVPGLGLCRRASTGTFRNGRPIGFFVYLPAPPAPAVNARYRDYPPLLRGPDFVLRLVVQTVRPYSELTARLAADERERDEQLTRVQSETRLELDQLRARLITIGAGTFGALVLGGWFIVATGLSPLRKLSDAVSRVSERDFHLDVEAAELGRELAPIHARLTQTLTLLQRAFAREKQAVADISHELRTPIASLLATIDVALRKPRTPEQYRNTLEECRLISKQLGQLVERIMTLALLDAGSDQKQVGPTDATELAAGCCAVIRPLAAANNITVSSHLTDGLHFDTDAAKLREVLMNLLHNAVEYNRPGGTIDLSARLDGKAAVFEVRDTGIGMTAEVRERIFERFYRADASRQATGVHAGLGLAIVKEYVERLGGVIAVESAPNQGTTFRVTLPLGESSTPSEQVRPHRVIAASS